MRSRILCITSVIALAVAACEQPTGPIEPVFGLNGNGFPSGSHYNLNLIGVKNDKDAAMEAQSDNGISRCIFVRLFYRDDTDGTSFSGACPVDMRVTERFNKIILEPGTDFGVMDANATDQNGALFRLPSTVSSQWFAYS